MFANPGYLPPDARGKRVRVRLRHGGIPAEPNGWAADGRSGCRWTLRDDPFDIIEYEVIE